MKRLVMGIGMICATAVPTASVFAANDGSGCGLGQVILEGKKGMGIHLAAAILNNLIIPQTSAMTSGTMGCDTSKQVKNEEERETFVADNMDNLSVDMAKGQGEYLAALAQIMGVEAQDTPAFYRVTQEQFASIGTAGSAHDMLAGIDGALVGDQSLSKYVR